MGKRRKAVIGVIMSMFIVEVGACGRLTEINVTTPDNLESDYREDISQNQDSEEVNTDIEDAETDFFPRMDGSTSATLLEAGLRASYQNIDYAEALGQVSHTTTHQSFDRLLAGEVDMIFTVPISDEQQIRADDMGIVLEKEPVAREGFVFVVNIHNPVDSLTTEQIQKIYAGEITNWSEVGGYDEPIVAYQRNKDSGSQNYMIGFMGDIPLMEVETTSITGGMEGMMNAIASYDNAEEAIGYSVYSYAAQMYANRNEVKFIAVDGTKPTKDTMADGTYPLLSFTYVLYSSGHERVKELRELVDWMISEEGQLAVLHCGYMPAVDMEIPEDYLPYDAIGTGPQRPDNYSPSTKTSYVYLYEDNGYQLDRQESIITYPDGLKNTYQKVTGLRLDCLTNIELQDEINEKIAEMIKQLEQDCDGQQTVITDALNSMRSFSSQNDKMIHIQIVNGYMSITIGYPIDIERLSELISIYPDGFVHYWYCETVCYDLINATEITDLTDLFYQGVDVDQLLNNSLTKNITGYYGADNVTGLTAFLGVDFAGLLGLQEKFDLTSLWFPESSPYFSLPVMFQFKDYSIMDSNIVYAYRNMDNVFTDIVKSYDRDVNEYEYGLCQMNGFTYYMVLDSRFHSNEEVEKRNALYIDMQDCARPYFDNINNYFHITESENSFSLTTCSVSIEDGYVHFRKDNHEMISLDQILESGWQDAMTFSEMDILPDGFLEEKQYSDYVFLLTPNIDEESSMLYLYSVENSGYYLFYIPNEYVQYYY